MPKPRLVQISSWSYSRYSDYKKCPQLARFKHVDKLKEPDSAAYAKGNRVHALAQVWVTGEVPPLDRDNKSYHAELVVLDCKGPIPRELETFAEEFAQLRKTSGKGEQSWGFDADWKVVRWDDWARCWLRVKTDFHYIQREGTSNKKKSPHHGFIIDYKTGKEYPEHEEQRSLYALGMFLLYPDLASVTAAHWYLEPGIERHDTWLAADFPKLKEYWTKRTHGLLTDTTFAPNPTASNCQWCHFRRTPHCTVCGRANCVCPGGPQLKTGPCEHG